MTATMKKILFILLAFFGLTVSAQTAHHANVRVSNVSVKEDHGTVRVHFTMDASSYRIRQNVKMAITPILYNQDKESRLREVILYSRSSRIIDERNRVAVSDGAFIAKDNKKIVYDASIPYQTWMNGGALRLDILQHDCCSQASATQNVASDLRLHIPVYEINPALMYAQPAVETTKSRSESGSAFVEFKQGSSLLLPDFRKNKGELQKISNSIDIVNHEKGTAVTGITLTGSSSPEASWSYNAKLADSRVNKVKNYIASTYHVNQNLFHTNTIPEDWAKLKILVESSSLPDKDQLLAVINSSLSPDAKEAKLARMAVHATLLNDIYPQLRKVDYQVNYNVRRFALAEAMSVIKTSPKNLSLDEMYQVAQTYPQNSPQYIDIMLQAAKIFPNDDTANLNAAMAALAKHDTVAAEQYIRQIKTKARIPMVDNAKGVLALMKGDYDTAEGYLQSAAQAGLQAAQKNLEELAKKRENSQQIKQQQ
jgi:outer membrane protein OmpA-like peptidoglycan-associated protein